MQVIYAGTNVNLAAAVAYVNQLAANAGFWQAIAAQKAFDFTDIAPPEVSRRLREAVAPMTIKVWSPPVWKAVAYRNTVALTDPDQPHTLFYHRSKLRRSVAEMVNTIVHEFTHSVDMFEDGDPRVEYGHGDQSPVGKENSAPYWIGALAETFYRASLAVQTSPAGEQPVVHASGPVPVAEVRRD
jgi:hypothetical protein